MSIKIKKSNKKNSKKFEKKNSTKIPKKIRNFFKKSRKVTLIDFSV